MILKTIDAHAAGQALRLVVDGFPAPRGKTMAEKRDWANRHADGLRRALMLEPRGHADMFGGVLTEPVSPGAHAGVLFFHNEGFSAMSGHGIIAVTTIALERGLVLPGGDGATVVFDTPAGSVRAHAAIRPDAERPIRVQRVSFINVPSFVLHAGLPVQVGARRFRADVAYGGEFYAIVDGESAGVAIDGAHQPELRRTAAAVGRALDGLQTIVHPVDSSLSGVSGTIFTGPAHAEGADLRNVAVFTDSGIDRSPCGTGTSAVMAVIDAMGLLGEDQPFVHESIAGTRFSGRLVGRTQVGDHPAIVTEIEGAAWITGEHTFFVDAEDPMKDGFRL